jgi:hypothetical protein
MKIIITESKIRDIITKYLDKHYDMDSFHLFNIESPLDARRYFNSEVDKYGSFDFDNNNHTFCTYYGEWDGYDYMYHLKVDTHFSEELNSLYNDVWIPVFKDWFEKKTGLEVREMVVNDEMVRFD